MPALRRPQARTFIPREVIRAQPLQYFELSLLRRTHAQAIEDVIQVISLMQELHPA
jgi:hypothetical protein